MSDEGYRLWQSGLGPYGCCPHLSSRIYNQVGQQVPNLGRSIALYTAQHLCTPLGSFGAGGEFEGTCYVCGSRPSARVLLIFGACHEVS